MASENVQKLVDAVKELTVLELSELVSELEEEFGVTAQAPVAVAAAPAAGGEAAGGADEKSDYDVILENVGGEKIKVIKEVRDITGLGLKDAKALVDGAPKAVKEGVPADEAEKIKEQLEAVGATVEIGRASCRERV